MQKKGFTIIELIVVIAIIAILAAVVMVNVTGYIAKSRDTRRKADLHNIAIALDMYFANNGHYPINTAEAVPGDMQEYYSTTGSSWLGELIDDKEFSVVPVDPRNIDQGPYCGGTGNDSVNTIYTYESDGQHYILCAWLENSSDPSRLQTTNFANPWNQNEKLLDSGYPYNSYIIAK